MKILVTGAYGLVGQHICKLLEKDYPNIEITKLKYRELALIKDNSIGFDFVIHAAGYGQPLKFSQDKIETIRIHTLTTDNLFRYLRPEGKFLFISSSEIYSGSPSPNKETDIGTTTPQHSRACYIEGKRCGEAICMAYKEQGYDVKIARLALAYGPGTKKYDTRVLNQLIEQAIMNKHIELLDDGGAVRTYCYVEDAAQMMLDILFKGKDIVYNVGGQSTVSIRELAVKIASLTGCNVSLGDKPLGGAPSEVKLDMTKTLTEFPRTFVSLDEGLKRTIEYQKQLYESN